MTTVAIAWEYKMEVLDLQRGGEETLNMSESQLNDLGTQGWELVSVLNKIGSGDSWCVAILKRHK